MFWKMWNVTVVAQPAQCCSCHIRLSRGTMTLAGYRGYEGLKTRDWLLLTSEIFRKTMKSSFRRQYSYVGKFFRTQGAAPSAKCKEGET